MTVAVADLDETVAVIEDRGLRSAPIETIAGARRKAALTDPEGNMTTFIEVVASGHCPEAGSPRGAGALRAIESLRLRLPRPD